MRQIQVLVLGMGGNVSQGILAALRNSTLKIRIVGACVSEESVGLYMCDSAFISPYAEADLFIPWVINICNQENIDIIFSGVEQIVYALEMHSQTIKKQTKAIFISSTLDKLQIGNDKLLTVQWLKENKLNFPLFAESNNKNSIDELIKNCGFPLIAKPRKGKGSIGIHLIKSLNDIENLNLEDYILQEYLGDESQEYTVACYVDKNEKVQDLIIMRRELKYGTTFKAEIVQNKAIKEECNKICSAFMPKGPLNIQLRIHNGIPICFELNVRYSGTTSIRARWGYNDVEAMIREYILGDAIHEVLKPHQEALVYRYFNEQYIDKNMYESLRNSKGIPDVSQYNNFQEYR